MPDVESKVVIVLSLKNEQQARSETGRVIADLRGISEAGKRARDSMKDAEDLAKRAEKAADDAKRTVAKITSAANTLLQVLETLKRLAQKAGVEIPEQVDIALSIGGAAVSGAAKGAGVGLVLAGPPGALPGAAVGAAIEGGLEVASQVLEAQAREDNARARLAAEKAQIRAHAEARRDELDIQEKMRAEAELARFGAIAKGF